MSDFITAVCPRCGTAYENTPDELVGTMMACLNCNHEFVVANVEVTGSDFTNDGVNVCCPHCGEYNLAPMTVIDHNVRCYACGAKFHISRKRRKMGSMISVKSQQSGQKISPTSVNLSSGWSKRKKIIVISCLASLALVIFAVTELPALVFAFKERTGFGAALVEIIYDDDICSVECNRALALENYATAIKWAKRMRVPERRKFALQFIETSRKNDKALHNLEKRYPDLWN